MIIVFPVRLRSEPALNRVEGACFVVLRSFVVNPNFRKLFTDRIYRIYTDFYP